MLLPRAHVAPEVDLLEGALLLEGGRHPGRLPFAKEHGAEEALAQPPFGAGEVGQAGARGQHHRVQPLLGHELLRARDTHLALVGADGGDPFGHWVQLGDGGRKALGRVALVVRLQRTAAAGARGAVTHVVLVPQPQAVAADHSQHVAAPSMRSSARGPRAAGGRGAL